MWSEVFVTQADSQYAKLVTTAEAKGSPLALPYVVANIGTLVMHHKSGPITTAFDLVVDIQSESKDIWLIHEGDCEYSAYSRYQDGCKLICADLLQYKDDISEEQCTQPNGRLPTQHPRFDIAWLNLTWDELLCSNMPDEVRRSRMLQGIAQSACRMRPNLQFIDRREIDKMGQSSYQHRSETRRDRHRLPRRGLRKGQGAALYVWINAG